MEHKYLAGDVYEVSVPVGTTSDVRQRIIVSVQDGFCVTVLCLKFATEEANIKAEIMDEDLKVIDTRYASPARMSYTFNERLTNYVGHIKADALDAIRAGMARALGLPDPGEAATRVAEITRELENIRAENSALRQIGGDEAEQLRRQLEELQLSLSECEKDNKALVEQLAAETNRADVAEAKAEHEALEHAQMNDRFIRADERARIYESLYNAILEARANG